MAFVAGYVSARRPYAPGELAERLRRFSIVPGDTLESYEQRVVTTGRATVMIRYKTWRSCRRSRTSFILSRPSRMSWTFRNAIHSYTMSARVDTHRLPTRKRWVGCVHVRERTGAVAIVEAHSRVFEIRDLIQSHT